MANQRNIRINFEENSIEITKAFAKKASIRGSKEYGELLDWKKDFADFKVVVRLTTIKSSIKHNITLADMEKYIEAHDGGTKLATFLKMKEETKGSKLERTTFFQIKKWFYEQYPELKKNVA